MWGYKSDNTSIKRGEENRTGLMENSKKLSNARTVNCNVT
jgi:hypothetical protein